MKRWMMLSLMIGLTAIGGCATPSVDTSLQDYEATPVETGTAPALPSDPKHVGVEDGLFLFDREGVQRWLTLSRLADDAVELAEVNAAIAATLAAERDLILHAGREAEREAADLRRALIRERWKWRGLAAGALALFLAR